MSANFPAEDWRCAVGCTRKHSLAHTYPTRFLSLVKIFSKIDLLVAASLGRSDAGHRPKIQGGKVMWIVEYLAGTDWIRFTDITASTIEKAKDLWEAVLAYAKEYNIDTNNLRLRKMTEPDERTTLITRILEDSERTKAAVSLLSLRQLKEVLA